MKSTKKLLPCITALILILSLIFTSCGSPDVTLKTKISVLSTVSGDYTDNGFHVINKDNMIFVTQSGLIELYYDKTTGAVAVKRRPRENSGTPCRLPRMTKARAEHMF